MAETKKPAAKKPATKKAAAPKMVKMVNTNGVVLDVHHSEVENYKAGGCVEA